MAVAFDTTSDGSFTVGPTTLTWQHTCGASATVLLVIAFTDQDSGSDSITGVTYNGVAMTQVGSHVAIPADRWISAWKMMSPPTGTAHDIVISASGADAIGGAAGSWSGVTSIEANASNTAASPAGSITGTVTTSASGAWTAALSKNDSGSYTAGTGTTIRVAGASGMAICDSNGPVTPGSNSLILTDTTNNPNWGIIIVSLAPSVADFPPVPEPPVRFQQLNALLAR